MLIFLAGSTGFIGSHLRQALLAAGHRVRCAVRKMPAGAFAEPGVEYVSVDFAEALDYACWLPHLSGVDAVINAVGIIREQGRQRFDTLHTRAPAALFEACVLAGVQRVIQISALGADAQARTAYHRSKHEADEALLRLPLAATVLQPSLVFGPSGASARQFMQLASLPLIPVPEKGEQLLQPVLIADLCDAVVRLVGQPALAAGKRIAAVGPQPASLRNYLHGLRRALLARPARFLPVPRFITDLAAAFGSHVPGALFTRDTWQMLRRGNHADSSAFAAVLGRTPRAIVEFLTAQEAQQLRRELEVSRWLVTLRLAIAAVWIITGIVSLWVFSVPESLALLHRTGVPPDLAPLLLVGAGWLDIVLGLATLVLPRRRRLWDVQIGLILFYTLIISLKLPEFWAHPYGPLVKNLPMLAGIALLRASEP